MKATISTGERSWAIVRTVLGFAQMAGAAFSLTVLVTTGFNTLSLVSVAVTGLLTTVSILLFGSRPHNPASLRAKAKEEHEEG